MTLAFVEAQELPDHLKLHCQPRQDAERMDKDPLALSESTQQWIYEVGPLINDWLAESQSNQAMLDLAWDPTAGLDIRNSAGLTVTGYAYSALTPVELRTLGFGTTHLASNAIPLALNLPNFDKNEIVFGARTNQGRLGEGSGVA